MILLSPQIRPINKNCLPLDKDLQTHTNMIRKPVICLITGFVSLLLLLSMQQEVLICSLKIYRSIPNDDHVTLKSCKQDISKKRADCRYLQLKKIPEDLVRDLRILDLSNNGIATVFNYSFSRYHLLNELHLASNKLRSIQPLGFYSLQHLRTLYLQDNELMYLSNGEVFKWLPKLSFLDLSNCHLEYVPSNLFLYLPEIQDVWLYSNNISSVKIPSCSSKVLQTINLFSNDIHQLTPETFEVSCKSDSIYLTGNDLQTIDPGTVASLHVRYLSLSMQIRTRDTWNNLFTGISRSNITELFIMGMNALENATEGFFAPLQNHYLRRLDLGFNDIHTLHQGTFANLTRVGSLVLAANFLKNIEPEHFTKMKDLRSINLNQNMIISINDRKSKWANNLQTLSLMWNRLTILDSYAFYGLENLTFIDLKQNYELSVIYITAFTGLVNLKEIRLLDCSLQEISLFALHLKSFSTSYSNRLKNPFRRGNIFKDTQSLEVIEITYSLQSFDLISFDRNLFAGLESLRRLYISYNNFDFGFYSDTFRNLSSLEELFINSSAIRFIAMGVFTGLTSLRVLDLRNNEIVHLPQFTSLYNLQNLYLDKNRLAYLSDTAFVNSTILSFISISNNLFVYFNRSSFDSLNQSMLSIDISRNPLTCKCEIRWLVSFLKDVNLINAEKTICSSAIGPLQPVENKPLLEFDLSKLCAPHVAVYAAIPVTILGLSTLMLTVYHFRWYLKYKLFLLKLAILGYDEIEDGAGPQDFEFELNVVYADNDEIWIQDHLRRALIDKMPEYNRNAIGDDSLPLTMYYLDAVYYVMENSYKIIFIVSRAAVQSSIFITKFRLAQDMVNDLQIEKIFVVFLDDIPDDEMPVVVRFYLSSRRPYMTWTDDERGREYFWDRFEKLLKVNKISNPLIPTE